MEKITFKNGQSPAINGTNLNQIQTNVENAINELHNIFHPIGSYYETSDVSFDPNVSWGGTWELDEDGTVLVSKSTKTGSKFNVSLGSIVGKEEHTLTVEEMPEHTHELLGSGGHSNALENAAYGGTTTAGGVIYGIQPRGGSQAHNNVQPSKVVNRWHRVA